MSSSIHILVLLLNIVLAFWLSILHEVSAVVEVDIGLCEVVSRLHLSIELIDPEFEHFQVVGIFGLAANARQCGYLQNLIVFMKILLGQIQLFVCFFGDRPLYSNLAETSPSYFLDIHCQFLSIIVLIQFPAFLKLRSDFILLPEVPEEGLLIVIPAEVYQISH